jgi:hypothetical protein
MGSSRATARLLRPTRSANSRCQVTLAERLDGTVCPMRTSLRLSVMACIATQLLGCAVAHRAGAESTPGPAFRDRSMLATMLVVGFFVRDDAGVEVSRQRLTAFRGWRRSNSRITAGSPGFTIYATPLISSAITTAPQPLAYPASPASPASLASLPSPASPASPAYCAAASTVIRLSCAAGKGIPIAANFAEPPDLPGLAARPKRISPMPATFYVTPAHRAGSSL